MLVEGSLANGASSRKDATAERRSIVRMRDCATLGIWCWKRRKTAHHAQVAHGTNVVFGADQRVRGIVGELDMDDRDFSRVGELDMDDRDKKKAERDADVAGAAVDNALTDVSENTFGVGKEVGS